MVEENKVNNVEAEYKPYDAQKMLAELDASIAAFKNKMNECNMAFLTKMCIQTNSTPMEVKPVVDMLSEAIEKNVEEKMSAANKAPAAAAASRPARKVGAANQRAAVSPKRKPVFR